LTRIKKPNISCQSHATEFNKKNEWCDLMKDYSMIGVLEVA